MELTFKDLTISKNIRDMKLLVDIVLRVLTFVFSSYVIKLILPFVAAKL